MTDKITKLTIDENTWLRAGWHGGLFNLDKLPNKGTYDDDGNYDNCPKDQTIESSLFDYKTKRMCCLGFASCAAGVAKTNMADQPTPSSLEIKDRNKISKKFPWLLDEHGQDSAASSKLMTINDNHKMSLPSKRAKIKKIFADNGVAVTFTR